MKKNFSECNNYRGILLVPYSGKVLPKVLASRLRNYRKAGGHSPRKRAAFAQHDHQSTHYSSYVDCKHSDENPPIHVLHRSAESI